MRYKESDKDLRQIAGELGVATILEGGVQRSGDRVRINARLVDAASDEDLWAEQYNLYLQGRHYWNRRTAEGLRTAIGYFERAIGLDSTYAPAWVGLADSYTILANWATCRRGKRSSARNPRR